MKKIFFYTSIVLVVFTPFFVSAATFDHDLYVGISNSAEVTMLQEFLHDQGLFHVSVTGNFFSLTKQAVIEFQEREGIMPARGYFGPKTRARANVLRENIVPSRAEQIALLQEKISALEAELAAIIAAQQPVNISSPLPSPTPSPIPSPILISEPSPSPDPSPIATSSPESTPSPTPLSTPISELRIDGSLTQPFPDTAVSPLKLGDITIKNTTDHAILFSQFQLDIYDAMNSSSNRNKVVLFKLRDGTATTDNLISETQFTINREPPPTGTEANRRQLDVSFPLTVNVGETKTVSLWIENLDYVINGYLRIEMLTAYISDGVTPQGGFTFLLTK